MLASLVSCGGGLGVDVVTAARLAIVGHPDTPISREVVNGIPYASIAAKIGKGPRSLLVLWRTEQEDLHWLSADGAAIVTRGGRVVKTAGLPTTIRNTVPRSPDPVAAGLHRGENRVYFDREIDLIPEGTVVMSSDFRELGPRSITIADIEFDTILIEERVAVRGLSWSFTNLYWVDPVDGFVWRSRQTISRDFPPIEIDVLKPALL